MSPAIALILGLHMACGPALSDDPPVSHDVTADSTTTPVAGAHPDGGSASDDSTGTAASAAEVTRPHPRPPRTPLLERPVEVLWWLLWWLPEHWRGEIIAALAGAIGSFGGFLVSRLGLRDTDPERFSRRDPRRWVVAAFSDRPVPSETAALEEEVTHLRREVKCLSGAVAARPAPRQEPARALSPEERRHAMQALKAIRTALGEEE